MERYIDGMNVSPRYEEIVGEFRNGGLGNFVGSYCGYPVFSESQKVINPITGEVVGYSNDIQIGRQNKVWMMPFENMLGTVYDKEYMTIDELLAHGETLLEKERRRSIPVDMGWAGIKAAAFSGAVAGLLEWFDYSSETSLAGAAAGAAIGGLSSVYCRHRDEKRFRRHLEWLSKVLFDMEKTVFSVNLLAPDSLIDSDAQTGSADNRQAINAYLIGGVPVDQQQRFDSFWDQADEILEEYGFTEWQEYRTVGMPELIRRILEDVHNNCDLDDDHKGIIVSKIRYFGRSRSSAIEDLEGTQEDSDTRNFRINHGLDDNDLTDPDKLVTDTDQIKQTDRKCAEAFCDFIAGIKEVCTEAKKESVQDLLVRIYGGKSSLQGYFWSELSRVLVAKGIDPYDKSVAEPAQFIVDILKMIPSGSEEFSSEDKVCKLYEGFYRLYSEKYPGMLPPDEFISKLSKDISLSKMHDLIYRIKHPQRIIFNI